MKEWFKARNLWGAAIQTLSDDEAGRLMKAIWGYTMTGEPQTLSGPEKGIYALIMLTLSQDEEKDADISEKRALAGAKGGKQKVANALFATSALAKEARATNKNKDIDTDKDIKERDVPSVHQERKRFMPPTLEQVTDYCRERNNKVNPQMFIDFYSAKGWRVGSQPMRDWKACVRTWEQRDKPTGKHVIAQDFPQRDYADVDSKIMSDLAEEMKSFLGGSP